MLSLPLKAEERTWHLPGYYCHDHLHQIQQIHASYLRNDERQKDLYAEKRMCTTHIARLKQQLDSQEGL